jgi:predicted cobalt transporter CbtA
VAAAAVPRGLEPGAWNPGRAFGRAAFGVAIGFGIGIFYEVSQDLSNVETDLRWSVLGGLAIIAAIFGGIVAAIEQFVPALRIPGGSAYAAVGHNRWIIAAALGVIPGLLLVAAGGEWAFVVMTVVGLLVAEALIGRPAQRRAA